MSGVNLLAVTESYNISGSTDSPDFLMVLVIGLAVYLIVSFLLSRVFQKAGRPAWAAFVPIYNGWVQFEISGKPGWWILFILIPYLGSLIFLVLSLLASLELAKRFGRSTLFGVLGLWLFSVIGYAILAFDSSKYNAAAVSAGSAPPNQNTPSDQSSSTPSSLVQ